MPKFALTYYMEPNFENSEGGDRSKFQAWLGELGDAVVNPGTPLGMPKTVSVDGVSENDGSRRSTGFSVVMADNMDAALEMAKACPFLEVGTVDVAEVFEM